MDIFAVCLQTRQVLEEKHRTVWNLYLPCAFQATAHEACSTATSAQFFFARPGLRATARPAGRFIGQYYLPHIRFDMPYDLAKEDIHVPMS